MSRMEGLERIVTAETAENGKGLVQTATAETAGNTERFQSRTELLLGREAVEKLAKSRVAVFGVGGVGGHVVEALARCGVGALDLVDKDRVEMSNLNRQIVALHSTLGRYKTEVAKERVLDINPDCHVKAWNLFFTPETSDQFDFSVYDYVVDAIDTVAGKLEVVKKAKGAGVPVICSMGAGNKLDPTAFRVADISRTKVCPLAKVMRHELKKMGIEKVKVVYSEEPPRTPHMEPAFESEAGGKGEAGAAAPKRRLPTSSVSFVPSVCGLVLAGEVIKDLIR